MKISVIVPWYKAEKWWSACETSINESIRRCTLHAEWEIVVVRDYDQRGVAWARNEGLIRAKGDWIVWVDADDEVSKEWAPTIEKGVSKFDEADVIVFDYTADGMLFSWGEKAGYIKREIFIRAIIADRKLKSYMWDKIFNRHFLSDKCFSEVRCFEDYDFWTCNVEKIRRIAYLPVNCYIHIGREDGLIAQPEARQAWVRFAVKRLLACHCKIAGAIALARALYFWFRTRI